MSTADGPRRSTRQRAALSEVLDSSAAFHSAQELHAQLNDRGSAVGLATVYRNLQAMQADGSVDVLRTDEGEMLYRACGSAAHHHHLVCRVCARTVEVEGPTVERWAASVAQDHGFTEVTHTLELFGTCDLHSRG